MCEWEFADARSGRKAIARLGCPIFDKAKKYWVCPTEISGLEGGEANLLASGDNPFGAIVNGIERFRRFFKTKRLNYDSPGGPPCFVFPLRIPTVYGADINLHIRGIVGCEIEKVERRLARRRSKCARS